MEGWQGVYDVEEWRWKGVNGRGWYRVVLADMMGGIEVEEWKRSGTWMEEWQGVYKVREEWRWNGVDGRSWQGALLVEGGGRGVGH